MRKIGIITLFDYYNHGNLLQNYAVQCYLSQIGFLSVTTRIKDNKYKVKATEFIEYKLKNLLFRIMKDKENSYRRYVNFVRFVKKNINVEIVNKNSIIKEKFSDDYSYFIVGSDQVWNPIDVSDEMFLKFAPISKRVTMVPSFGVSNIEDSFYYKDGLNGFNKICVREDDGKILVNELTGKEATVLVDPTMVITKDKWLEIAEYVETDGEYVFCYFLGNEFYNEEVQSIADSINAQIINISDRKSSYYQCGPSEFVYLISNAKLVCTDSFHGTVFSILFNKPFLSFERKNKGKSMNTRIITLLKKFYLEDNIYGRKNIADVLTTDYHECNQILEMEKKKFNDYFRCELLNAYK